MCVQCRCSIGPTVQITATMWMHARLSLLPPLTMMTTTNYSNCFTTKNLFSGDNSHTQINMNKKLRAGNGLWWSWFCLPDTHTFQLISIVCVQVGFSTSFFLLILLFFQIMYTHFFSICLSHFFPVTLLSFSKISLSLNHIQQTRNKQIEQQRWMCSSKCTWILYRCIDGPIQFLYK